MPRRALTTQGPVEAPAHLLLQDEHEGTALERRLRRYAHWRLSPVRISRVEWIARELIRQGRPAREVLEEIAGFEVWAEEHGVRLTTRERRQVAFVRKALHPSGELGGRSDPAEAHRVLRRWLAKGKLRRRIVPPPLGVPVWVDLMRCVKCNRPEAALRKSLTRRDVHGREEEAWAVRVLPFLPSGEEGFGYCRTCKRRWRFRVVDSRHVPASKVRTLVSTWMEQPPLARSRFLLEKVWGPAVVGRVKRGEVIDDEN